MVSESSRWKRPVEAWCLETERKARFLPECEDTGAQHDGLGGAGPAPGGLHRVSNDGPRLKILGNRLRMVENRSQRGFGRSKARSGKPHEMRSSLLNSRNVTNRVLETYWSSEEIYCRVGGRWARCPWASRARPTGSRSSSGTPSSRDGVEQSFRWSVFWRATECVSRWNSPKSESDRKNVPELQVFGMHMSEVTPHSHACLDSLRVLREWFLQRGSRACTRVSRAFGFKKKHAPKICWNPNSRSTTFFFKNRCSWRRTWARGSCGSGSRCSDTNPWTATHRGRVHVSIEKFDVRSLRVGETVVHGLWTVESVLESLRRPRSREWRWH